MLADYEPPPIDAARDEELRDWIDAEEGVVPGLERLAGQARRGY